MTDEELQAIQERESKAAPPKWRVSVTSRGPFLLGPFGAGGPLFMDEDDAVFIAHARQDIPALRAEVEFLKGLVRDLQIDSAAYQRGYEQALKDGKASEESLRLAGFSLASGAITLDHFRAVVGLPKPSEEKPL